MKVVPLTEIPLIEFGDNIGDILLDSLEKQEIGLKDGDILVIAQTVISKAEGNVLNLSSIETSSRAEEIASEIGKDPRKVEVILEQTDEIVRLAHVIITRTKHGFICADAGVDESNVEDGFVSTLPDDPDASAGRIRERVKESTGKDIAVIISDSWGRPFRLGSVSFAIGVSGIKPLLDLRGEEDAYGRNLKNAVIAHIDSLAAAASLEMGESAEKVPAVLIRGYDYESGEGSISELIRSEEKDLFR